MYERVGPKKLLIVGLLVGNYGISGKPGILPHFAEFVAGRWGIGSIKVPKYGPYKAKFIYRP